MRFYSENIYVSIYPLSLSHTNQVFIFLSSYIICACTTLKLLLKSFSSVILSNVKQPTTPTTGIDIAREERLVQDNTASY